MKAIARILGLMAIVGAVLAIPAPSGAEAPGAMRVRLVEGDVQVKIAETGEWAPVSVNMPLLEGDELWVPDGSRAAIQTSDGSYVRLGDDTAFEVLRTDRDSFQFHLGQGHAYVLNRGPKGSVLQIDTPDASVRAFGKATFRVDIPDGETDIAVFKGSVLAESDAGTTKVRRGDMLVLAPDGYAELSPLPEPDDWERWNRGLDRIALARRESTQYLPGELQAYSDDFDQNGRWVDIPDYGYCWTPTVVVIGDWAPYRHGRWCWRGGDYVWIGYEPWGWAPYHYGRWAFVARVGWCWVPPERDNVHWGPGYVGWVRTPDHVAWVPLAPRETYYGYGNYGRYSVNVTNVNISRVQVTNVYRNVNVTNSITVVNQATFITGRPGTVSRNAVADVREDFAGRRNIVVGRPQIKPVETSYVPVVRSIPEAKRPPAAIRKIDVKELRQSRPMVRETGRSAIRPAERARPLEVRKVETPRSVNERVRERRQAPPQERRGPGTPQGGPPGRMDRRSGQPSGPTSTEGRVPRAQDVRKPIAVPQERGKRETPPAPPANRMDRGGEQPQERPTSTEGRVPRAQDVRKPIAAPRERGKGETPPAPPASRMERGGERQEGPRAPAERGQRDAAPAVRTTPPPPAPAERGVERGRPQQAPAERPRPQKPQDNTERPTSTERRVPRAQDAQERPAAPPQERDERGRR